LKNQYVGDISDFEKYSILRALRTSSRLPLVVVWMLTAPDERGDGAKVGYLNDPGRYRALDPHVFDCLERIVFSGERTVDAVEDTAVLAPASFVGRTLDDRVSSRAALLSDLWDAARGPSLVFFDPDIGVAGKSVRRGKSRSSMYVFPEELASTFQLDHSLVIYQHLPRKPRVPFLSRTLMSLRKVCNASQAFALWSSRVAFLVVPQDETAERLAKTCEQLASGWAPYIAFHPGTELVSGAPPVFVDPGLEGSPAYGATWEATKDTETERNR
jgi:hypothetical protein